MGHGSVNRIELVLGRFESSGTIKSREFLDHLSDCFLRMTLPCGVCYCVEAVLQDIVF